MYLPSRSQRVIKKPKNPLDFHEFPWHPYITIKTGRLRGHQDPHAKSGFIRAPLNCR